MDRRFAWLGAALGALAVWKWRRPKPDAAEEPAESLRAKLEESRAAAEAEPEPQQQPPVADEADLDARRRSVHEDARARMEELRGE
jgi:hypothetical protein